VHERSELKDWHETGCNESTHGFKGLEVDVAFIPHLQRTFQREEQEYVTAERRILYMAMSRAREKLYMTYFGKLPRPYEDLRRQNLADFVG
jgi:superfamily I DNA/RNA helicase